MTFGEAMAFALTLPGAEAGTSYGRPAAKAGGRAFLSVGNEPATSFVLHLDHGTIDMLREAAPGTFWKTPHYEGWPAVLVRSDAADDGLVRDMIARAHERALVGVRSEKRR